jgi:hypothetical protein
MGVQQAELDLVVGLVGQLGLVVGQVVPQVLGVELVVGLVVFL